ncbi:MAG: NlpC/P60 family protein [Gammaproteobacteria bacterium]|nr:MAG: NlpC/P60 family protein [Gammaproteobacteria bacterium]
MSMYRRLQCPILCIVALLLAACSTTGPAPGPETSSLRQEIVSIARAQIGKPYRYGGRSPRQGFDCSGLVQYAHRQAGLEIPRTAREQLGHGRPVSSRHIRPGDLLFFSVTGKPDHVALYLGDGVFVHAPSSGKKVSTERLDNPWWRRRLVAVRSFIRP